MAEAGAFSWLAPLHVRCLSTAHCLFAALRCLVWHLPRAAHCLFCAPRDIFDELTDKNRQPSTSESVGSLAAQMKCGGPTEGGNGAQQADRAQRLRSLALQNSLLHQ